MIFGNKRKFMIMLVVFEKNDKGRYYLIFMKEKSYLKKFFHSWGVKYPRKKIVCGRFESFGGFGVVPKS